MYELKDTINGVVWNVGDKFLCPRYEGGKWITCGESFKFLKDQYEVVEKGWAFRFNETGDGSYAKAMDECMKLVTELNKKIL